MYWKKFYELHDKYINTCTYEKLIKDLYKVVVEKTLIKPKKIPDTESRLEQWVNEYSKKGA